MHIYVNILARITATILTVPLAQIRAKSYAAAMPQLNVSLPDSLKAWTDARVAEGRFSSPSDYVRDLIRRDQDAAAELRWPRGAG